MAKYGYFLQVCKLIQLLSVPWYAEQGQFTFPLSFTVVARPRPSKPVDRQQQAPTLRRSIGEEEKDLRNCSSLSQGGE
jgi:hypothetical protein